MNQFNELEKEMLPKKKSLNLLENWRSEIPKTSLIQHSFFNMTVIDIFKRFSTEFDTKMYKQIFDTTTIFKYSEMIIETLKSILQ